MDDIVSLLQKLNSSISSSVRVCMPGSIESYDFKTQKANVKISMKEVYANKKEVDYPVVNNVPVVFMSSGGASITLPVNVGDSCLLLFADRDMSEWLLGAVGKKPVSTRMHHLSDAIAIMGLQPFTKVDGAKNNDDLAINFAGSTISIKKDGEIDIITTKTVNVKSIEVINIESKDVNIKASETLDVRAKIANVKVDMLATLESKSALVRVEDLLTIEAKDVSAKVTEAVSLEAKDASMKISESISIDSKNANIKVAENISIESKNATSKITEAISLEAMNMNAKVSELTNVESKNVTLNIAETITTNCKDAVIIASGEIKTTATKLLHTGNLEVTGNIQSTGSIKSGNITLGTHRHSYSAPLVGSTPTAEIPSITGTPT